MTDLTQTSNKEYWFEQNDLDYLHSHYIGLVREGFAKSNLAESRKRQNKIAAMWGALIVVAFITFIVLR